MMLALNSNISTHHNYMDTLLVSGLVNAADPDAALNTARQKTGQDDPPESAVAEARQRLLEGAAMPFAANPDLRQRLVDIFGKTSP